MFKFMISITLVFLSHFAFANFSTSKATGKALIGIWYTQGIEMQGLDIQYFSQNGRDEVTVNWYTYGSDQKQRWIFGYGQITSAGSVTLDLIGNSNGNFMASTTDARVKIGSITLTPITCQSLKMSWKFNDSAASFIGNISSSGSSNLIRLTPLLTLDGLQVCREEEPQENSPKWCNGQLKGSTIKYYPNGETMTYSGSLFYYPNGKSVTSGASIYYPNEKPYTYGAAQYYMSNQSVLLGSSMYYPNGQYTKSGSTCYYSTGTAMQFEFCPTTLQYYEKFSDSSGVFEIRGILDTNTKKIINRQYAHTYAEGSVTISSLFEVTGDGKITNVEVRCN